MKAKKDKLEQNEDEDEICPICKSSRYLNRDMKFLVNSVCYHKMCESCMDRIFSLGPAPCPYPGCGKTLRKNRFKKQTFQDIQVERELDIRKRVAHVFNKRQEDFDTLLEYNNYLEELELTIFNLVNNIDVDETEAKLREYEKINRNLIQSNADLLMNEKSEQQRQLDTEANRRIMLRKIAENDRHEDALVKQQVRSEIVRSLAENNKDRVNEIQARIQASANRKSAVRRQQFKQQLEAQYHQSLSQPDQAEQQQQQQRKRRRAKQVQTPPFTPFAGDRPHNKFITVQSNYYDPYLKDLKSDPTYQASGFQVKQEYRRALFEAFCGLGCNISQEKSQQPEMINT